MLVNVEMAQPQRDPKEKEQCNMNIDVDDNDFEDNVKVYVVIEEWVSSRNDRVLTWGAFD